MLASDTEYRGAEWIIDLEIALVRAFGWSLYEIDRTDIESLLPFVQRLTDGGEMSKTRPRVYCDQIEGL